MGAPATLTPFLSDEDYDQLRWYLEEYMDLPDGGAVIRAHGIEQQIGRWGSGLHDAVFGSKENAALLEQLLEAPEPRSLTIATDVSTLLRLPWEIIADGAGSLAHRISVRRQLETPRSLIPREVQLPLRLLYVVSRPADTGFIDPRLTTRALVAALDPLHGNVQLDFCRPPTAARMEEMLSEAQAAGDPYDVLHFDGHGTFLPEAQIGALCFEAPDDGAGESKTDFVRADRLGHLLAKFRIPLVVLEACRSATVGKTAVFRSVAPRLIHAGVGSVLSMGHAVHVEAARLLLDRFYRELARGASIGQAVAEGRSALMATRARWIEYGPGGRSVALNDWFLPHLYQRGVDETLLPPGASPPTAVPRFGAFLSHNHADSSRVETLARTLVTTHGLRVWLDKWEATPGPLEPQCEVGIRDSRFTIVVGSARALRSKWVAWEIATHVERDPERRRLLPLKFEELELPAPLGDLLWVDFTDPAKDGENAALLNGYIRSIDAEEARRHRGFRPLASRGEAGAFPEPPQFGFQGRARELHDLERALRSTRGIVLHAMGGMGKTTLATEAAHWWTRSGLFRDGACFLSFEKFTNAERAIGVLGEYCEGPRFHQRPAAEQRMRAIEFFRDRALLMVWDNYESVLPQFNRDAAGVRAGSYSDEDRVRLSDLFRDLTTGAGHGRVLVTCRPGETGLANARRFELHGLSRADSLWLLHRILERDGHSLDDPRLSRDKLEPLLRDLADHPLSLELVGPHLRTMTPEAIRADFAQLVQTMTQSADVERNTSLLASLEFSRRHLSPAARAALPSLGLFSGGVFEAIFLTVSGIGLDDWEPIRSELQGIALLRADYEITLSDRPFLRFHPTLNLTSSDTTAETAPETQRRFVDAYLALKATVDRAMAGAEGKPALEVVDREEMNWRKAAKLAIASGDQGAVSGLASAFSEYLRRSGRLREVDPWIRMLRQGMDQVGFSEEQVVLERQYAQSLLRGNPAAALSKLRALVERLRHTTEFDPQFQLARTIASLGESLLMTGAVTESVSVMRDAVDHWERLVERKAGEPWQALLAASEVDRARAELRNLSASLGTFSMTLRLAGRYDEALEVAEKGLLIDKASGNIRDVAVAHVQCAEILLKAGHLDAADARYDLALAEARRVGDKEAEGTTLQHQGALADDRGQFERAIRLYVRALAMFEESGDTDGRMTTYNLLGVVERRSGRLAEARTWYEKSRELALELQNQQGISTAVLNIASLRASEGDIARQRGDEVEARRLYAEARVSFKESCAIWRTQEDQIGEADSLSGLAALDLRLGDLDAATSAAEAALRIREPLGLIEAAADYHILAEIADRRGDAAAATEWRRKRDVLVAESKRRAGGDAIPEPLLQAIKGLALACARAGIDGDELDPETEESLAQMAAAPEPFPPVAAALRELSAGRIPSVPAGLPKSLHEVLDDVIRAIGER